jgi:hypothetical protein
MENLMTNKDTTADPKPETELEDSPGVSWPVQPIPMPGIFDVVAQEVDGESIIVIVVYTASGASFAWLPREHALEFAGRVKKAANTGPDLSTAATPVKKQTAPPKSKLIVKGSGH